MYVYIYICTVTKSSSCNLFIFRIRTTISFVVLWREEALTASVLFLSLRFVLLGSPVSPSLSFVFSLFLDLCRTAWRLKQGDHVPSRRLQRRCRFASPMASDGRIAPILCSEIRPVHSPECPPVTFLPLPLPLRLLLSALSSIRTTYV